MFVQTSSMQEGHNSHSIKITIVIWANPRAADNFIFEGQLSGEGCSSSNARMPLAAGVPLFGEFHRGFVPAILQTPWTRRTTLFPLQRS